MHTCTYKQHTCTYMHTDTGTYIYMKAELYFTYMPEIHSEGGKETPLMNNNRICFFFFLPLQLPTFVGTVNDSLPLRAQQLCSPTLLLNSFWHLKSRWGRERQSVKSSASLSPAASACNCQSGLRETENNAITVHFLLRETGERTISREGKQNSVNEKLSFTLFHSYDRLFRVYYQLVSEPKLKNVLLFHTHYQRTCSG